MQQRLQKKKRKSEDINPNSSLTTILDKINQLERESFDDDDSDSSSDQEVIEEITNDRGEMVGIVSSLLNNEENRIQPLPRSQLPAAQCRTTSSKYRDDDKIKKNKTNISNSNNIKRKVSFNVESEIKNISNEGKGKPFYCRLCQYQGTNLEELIKHRQSRYHISRERKEKEVCSCKLCRKSFTSRSQLEEHNKGKAHLERLSSVSNWFNIFMSTLFNINKYLIEQIVLLSSLHNEIMNKRKAFVASFCFIFL